MESNEYIELGYKIGLVIYGLFLLLKITVIGIIIYAIYKAIKKYLN